MGALSDAASRFVMGGLIDVKDRFREMKSSNPSWSFPECVDAYQRETGEQLNNIQVNHALQGFESAEKDLR